MRKTFTHNFFDMWKQMQFVESECFEWSHNKILSSDVFQRNALKQELLFIFSSVFLHHFYFILHAFYTQVFKTVNVLQSNCWTTQTDVYGIRCIYSCVLLEFCWLNIPIQFVFVVFPMKMKNCQKCTDQNTLYIISLIQQICNENQTFIFKFISTLTIKYINDDQMEFFHWNN